LEWESFSGSLELEWENGWSKILLLNSNSELELITSTLELELGTQTKKVKTFYSPWHTATVDKKEYNNVVLKIKYLYVHA